MYVVTVCISFIHGPYTKCDELLQTGDDPGEVSVLSIDGTLSRTHAGERGGVIIGSHYC